MKKIILAVFVLGAVLISGKLLANGGEDEISKYCDTAENNHMPNDGSGIAPEAENNTIDGEKPEKYADIFNDLVYREYERGCSLEEGCNVFIDKDRVLGEVNNVRGIVILLDNAVYKEFDPDDGNIEFTAEKGGNYIFFAIDSEGTFVDIMSMAEADKPANGGLIPLG